MHGDVHRIDASILELGDELALLVWVETDIAADAEYQVFLVFAPCEGVSMRVRADLLEDVELLPDIEDTEISVRIKAGHELVSLMKHVRFQRTLNLVP